VSDRCSWCGSAVEDGYRVYAAAGSAAFCRLEHIVPWAIRGAAWEPRGPREAAREATCSWCGADALIDVRRSRGEHEVPDAFCSVAHLLEWAKAGGRYR
jgi:hypothetical protein